MNVVLLIPGLFGFNAFGPNDAPILEYFSGVTPILQPAGDRVFVHEPPPTGSLTERVRSLHEAVWKLTHGIALPHAPEAVTASRVRLVGHSTGGVDARLLMNPKYAWPGAATDHERAQVRAAVDKVVTVSAPFKGTPTVDDVAWIRDPALAVVRALAMMGAFEDGALDTWVLGSLSGISSPLLPAKVIGKVPSSLVAQTARRAAARRGASPGDAKLVATQVQAFLHQIETDRKLYKDLSLEDMATLDAQIAGGDFPGILSYVTVSPAPSIYDVRVTMSPNFIYVALYTLTAMGTVSDPPPTARRSFGPAPTIAKALAGPRSCDGVVPTRSQTIDGVAEGVVLGDHLDVVGTFRNGALADVMRSGSHFDQARFTALWGDIASRLSDAV